MAKTKIDGATTDNEKKDDSGNETGAGEGEPEEEPDVVHYDKTKSFFDNISCEAVERSKGWVTQSFFKYNFIHFFTHFSRDTTTIFIKMTLKEAFEKFCDDSWCRWKLNLFNPEVYYCVFDKKLI